MKKFAHEAEEKFARILNFYNLEWHYEPTLFILRKTDDGIVKRGFTPDFYVPEYELYVEITVMQKATKKRKKIAATLDLYPDVNIILIDRNDMSNLEKRYAFLFC